jgi:hypothetical protein
MKLSCIPICLLADIAKRKFRAEQWYEMAARLKLDGIEMYDGYLEKWDEKHLRNVARRVSDLGLAVSMFTGYGDLANPDPKYWQKAVDMVKRNVDVAPVFSTKIVRVVAGVWPKDFPRDEVLANVARGLRACLDYARERQVLLALEDHPQVGTDICDFLGIIMRVGSDDLKVNLDTFTQAIGTPGWSMSWSGRAWWISTQSSTCSSAMQAMTVGSPPRPAGSRPRPTSAPAWISCAWPGRRRKGGIEAHYR